METTAPKRSASDEATLSPRVNLDTKEYSIASKPKESSMTCVPSPLSVHVMFCARAVAAQSRHASNDAHRARRRQRPCHIPLAARVGVSNPEPHGKCVV